MLPMAEAISSAGVALQPTPESKLNCRASSSRKRKHADDAAQDPYLEPFTATVGQELVLLDMLSDWRSTVNHRSK
jgi:hypothetical protein